MPEKLTRNTSTPKLAKWWDGVEKAAAQAPYWDGKKWVDPRDRHIRELEQAVDRMAKLLTCASDALDDGRARPMSLVIRIDRELDLYRKAKAGGNP